jgi:hypothetical protein
MSGPVTVAASGGATFYAAYELTADGLVSWELCIDGISTGSAPQAAWIQIEIEESGGSPYFIVATPVGPNRVAASMYLPKGTTITGAYNNGDSISHYVSGFISVFYPGNI